MKIMAQFLTGILFIQTVLVDRVMQPNDGNRTDVLYGYLWFLLLEYYINIGT